MSNYSFAQPSQSRASDSSVPGECRSTNSPVGRYRTRDEARSDIFDYIERFYNPQRRHSTLDYVSPVTYEQSKTAQKI